METWLTDNLSLLHLPNFNCYFSAAVQTGGRPSGGIVSFIKQKSCNIMNTVFFTYFIAHFIEINYCKNYLMGVYRPPSYDISNVTDSIEELLVSRHDYIFVIFGDFNARTSMAVDVTDELDELRGVPNLLQRIL